MSRQFDDLYKADITTGRMNKNAVLITHKWFPGGHLNLLHQNIRHTTDRGRGITGSSQICLAQ